MKDSPLTHLLGLGDSLWGHIAENRVRIRRIERTLDLESLSDQEREDITGELQNEAYTK